ncbi:hypothetical protein ACTFIV_007533 [Dictyostelium citrinum]
MIVLHSSVENKKQHKKHSHSGYAITRLCSLFWKCISIIVEIKRWLVIKNIDEEEEEAKEGEKWKKKKKKKKENEEEQEEEKPIKVNMILVVFQGIPVSISIHSISQLNIF